MIFFKKDNVIESQFKRDLKLLRIAYEQRKEIYDFIIDFRKKHDILMGISDIYALIDLVKRTSGNIAEVGVYKGGSAKLISEFKKNRELHLFDTFEGLPYAEGKLHQGQFSASLEEVKELLKQYSNIHFYKGLFPDTAKPIENKTFGFVNLDVDLSKSIIDCLNFFYPRMEKGGIILTHDWNIPDAKKAIEEFKEGVRIELSPLQCVIIKYD